MSAPDIQKKDVTMNDRQGESLGENPEDKLGEYRKSIDNIDAALVHLLSERFKITKKVGEYKAKMKLPPADKSRERDQVARLRALAETAELDPDFTEEFVNFIIREVIRHHERLRAGS